MPSNQDIQELLIKLKYTHRKIRENITLQDLAEVVLMLSQEVTDLKKRIQQLEEERQ